MTGTLDALAARLRSAARVSVITGAGVSAASGVPTFRSQNGFWRQYRPEDLATPQAFERDPEMTWGWYAWRRKTIARSTPNAAHKVLAAWSRAFGQCTIITQNVDDLHLRAGTKGLVRLHGSIWELICAEPCRPGARSWSETRVPLPQCPPRCPHCGGLARPAVVWFGEALNGQDVRAAYEATVCDVFIAIGTSAVVYPAADFLHEAAAQGAYTAEINVESTPISSVVDAQLLGAAEVILPTLDALL